MFSEVTDMLLFAAVARAGSLTRAGRELGLPKSTVSRRMTALEERVGSRLLHKTTRRLVLTEAGKGFLEHCQRLAEEADTALRYAADIADRPRGKLRMTLPPDLNDPRLHGAITGFCARYPEIELEIDESARVVDLASEPYDLALRAGVLADSTLVARLLTEITSGIYASPSYLAHKPLPRTPADLAQHRFVILQGQTRHERIELRRGTEHATVKLSGQITATTTSMLLRLGFTGAGAIWYPEAQAIEGVTTGRLVRLLPEWSSAPDRLWIVTPSRRLLARKTVLLIEALSAAFAGSHN